MNNPGLFYRLYIYLVLALVIFLFLTYLIKLNVAPAIVITILILVIIFFVEIVFVPRGNQVQEGFKGECEDESKQLVKKCQIVCNTKIKNQPTTSEDEEEEQAEEAQEEGEVQGAGESQEGEESGEEEAEEGEEEEGEEAGPRKKKKKCPRNVRSNRTHILIRNENLDKKLKLANRKLPSRSDYPVNDNLIWGTTRGYEGYDDRMGFGGMFYDDHPDYNKYHHSDKDEKTFNNGKRLGGKRTPHSADDGLASHNEWARKAHVKAHGVDGYVGPYQDVGDLSEVLKTTDNHRRIVGPLDDELPYSDYNHLPVAAGYKSHAYEYGYSYLPPERWYPLPPRPPICITEKKSIISPSLSNGSVADLKEFHIARRVHHPDRLNVEYVQDKLNAGR